MGYLMNALVLIADPVSTDVVIPNMHGPEPGDELLDGLIMSARRAAQGDVLALKRSREAGSRFVVSVLAILWHLHPDPATPVEPHVGEEVRRRFGVAVNGKTKLPMAVTKGVFMLAAPNEAPGDANWRPWLSVRARAVVHLHSLGITPDEAPAMITALHGIDAIAALAREADRDPVETESEIGDAAESAESAGSDAEEANESSLHQQLEAALARAAELEAANAAKDSVIAEKNAEIVKRDAEIESLKALLSLAAQEAQDSLAKLNTLSLQQPAPSKSKAA
jgi:hypothetical protein